MTDYAQSEPEVRLPRPPGAIRRWFAEHPRVIDMVILAGFFMGVIPFAIAGVLAEVWESGLAPTIIMLNSAFTVLKIGAVATALVLRRSHPFFGVIVTSLACIGDGNPAIVAYAVALCFFMYAVPVYDSVKVGWIAYGFAVASGFVDGFVRPLYSQFITDVGGTPIADGIINAVLLLVILLVGINLGNRRRYVAAIIDRARQLARERDQRAQLAVAEERSRIAREMHDIVAHSVSVMIALAEGSARAVEVAPDEAASAMRRSAETGRTALTEMRRLLGALQTGEAAELAPQPGVGDITELVHGFVDAGLRVTYSGANFRLDDRPKELAIYRVVQEGLTNVLRYAGAGARAEVHVSQVAGSIEVLVRDYGSAVNVGAPATGLGSGRGLTGLAERVRMFGGTIESGPVSGEPGWRLRAVLPFEAPAATVIPAATTQRVEETE